MDDRFVFMAVDWALASEKASFVSYRTRLEPLMKEEEGGGEYAHKQGVRFFLFLFQNLSSLVQKSKPPEYSMYSMFVTKRKHVVLIKKQNNAVAFCECFSKYNKYSLSPPHPIPSLPQPARLIPPDSRNLQNPPPLYFHWFLSTQWSGEVCLRDRKLRARIFRISPLEISHACNE